jgi:hypothetical protein
MFTQTQHLLRNCIYHAKSVMKLNEETYHSLLNLVTVMSEKPYLRLGIGEDVAAKSEEVVLADGALRVDQASAREGVVTFLKAAYAQEVLLNEVILEGDGVSYQVVKAYKNTHHHGSDVPLTKRFGPEQLPLKSDNFTLEVTIQPGGYLRKAVLLHEIVN